MRNSYHNTGTMAFRQRLRDAVPVAIANALKIIPGDEWLASSRHLYQVRSDPPPGSPESRARCTAARWWCDLLHVPGAMRLGNSERASSLLDSALAHMPPLTSCVWNDVSALISDNRARRAYERAPCSERSVIDERLWWLTDPLHTVQGNERKVDHFARQIEMRLAIERPFPNPRATAGFPWGLKLVRFSTTVFSPDAAVPEDYTDSLTFGEWKPTPEVLEGFLPRAFRVARTAQPRTTEFERMQSNIRLRSIAVGSGGSLLARPQSMRPQMARLQLVPAFAAVAEPFLAADSDWELNPTRPRELGYSYTGMIEQLDHQHAYFLRGDSARLVVVADASRSSPAIAAHASSRLAWSRSPRAPPFIVTTNGGPRHVHSPLVPADSMLVSLEVVDPRWGAARARFGAIPPSSQGQRVHLSDIALLTDRSGEINRQVVLDSLLPDFAASTRVPQGATVGVFWEIYGLRQGEQPEISVSVVTQSESQAASRRPRTLADTTRGRRGSRISFSDVPASGSGLDGRTYTIDLSSLAAGHYLIEVRVQVAGEQLAYTSRRLEIMRR